MKIDSDLARFDFLGEWTAGRVQDDLLDLHGNRPSVDDLLCNPGWARRIDDIGRQLRPGHDPHGYRGMVFRARKRAAPRAQASVVAPELPEQLLLGRWKEKPAGTAGVYTLVANREAISPTGHRT